MTQSLDVLQVQLQRSGRFWCCISLPKLDSSVLINQCLAFTVFSTHSSCVNRDLGVHVRKKHHCDRSYSFIHVREQKYC